MKTTFTIIDLKSGKDITTKRGKNGRITGWVGNPPDCVRVQWDDGQIIDFNPQKLLKRIKTLN